MGHLQLTVQPRADFGSAASRRLRRQGLVPGVLYQSGGASLAFQLTEREIRKLLQTEGARSAVIDLRIGDASSKPALIKDWEIDPVKSIVLHVDMAEVDLTETIQAVVEVVLVGTSTGVRDGGVLDQPLHTVTVEALPDALPDRLELDVTELGLGQAAHVSDLTAPDGVRIVDDPETVVASITTASSAEVAEDGEEGEPELVGGKDSGE